MIGDAPCKNCNERHCRCHAECCRYASYVEERKTENERRLCSLNVEKGLYEHKLRTSYRIKHSNNTSKIIRSRKK